MLTATPLGPGLLSPTCSPFRGWLLGSVPGPASRSLASPRLTLSRPSRDRVAFPSGSPVSSQQVGTGSWSEAEASGTAKGLTAASCSRRPGARRLWRLPWAVHAPYRASGRGVCPRHPQGCRLSADRPGSSSAQAGGAGGPGTTPTGAVGPAADQRHGDRWPWLSQACEGRARAGAPARAGPTLGWPWGHSGRSLGSPHSPGPARRSPGSRCLVWCFGQFTSTQCHTCGAGSLGSPQGRTRTLCSKSTLITIKCLKCPQT